MAKLTLQDMTVQALQGRAAKKAPTSTAAISDSQTSKLYSIVADKGLIAGDTPRTTQETASAVLESIGCTIASSTKYPKDFSLERTQIQEPLENKNIVDPNITQLKNLPSSPNNKFKSTTGPFYEMDDAPAVYQQLEQDIVATDALVDTSQLCSDIYVLNATVGTSQKIKQLS